MTEANIRHQRVRDYLHNLYGKEPTPLRSYITNLEVLNLLRNCPDGAKIMVLDLDITRYGGKWKSAVEDSIRAGLDPTLWEFWHKARLHFLELGGCYKRGMEPTRNE